MKKFYFIVKGDEKDVLMKARFMLSQNMVVPGYDLELGHVKKNELDELNILDLTEDSE